MKLNDVRISLKNILADPTKNVAEVVEVKEDIDKQTQNITGYRLNILTCKYSRNPVKLPVSDEVTAKIGQLKELLKAQEVVSVRLNNPVVRLYSLLGNNNTIISGVSIKADTFDIISEVDDLLN